jgi:hypothetical protein
MAHGKVIVINPISEETKTLPIGYSWTVLFWGCFPALFRQDWKNFAIIAGVIFVAGLMKLALIPLIVFSIIYNKMCFKDHLDNGWKIKSYYGSKSLDAVAHETGYNLNKYLV